MLSNIKNIVGNVIAGVIVVTLGLIAAGVLLHVVSWAWSW